MRVSVHYLTLKKLANLNKPALNYLLKNEQSLLEIYVKNKYIHNS